MSEYIKGDAYHPTVEEHQELGRQVANALALEIAKARIRELEEALEGLRAILADKSLVMVPRLAPEKAKDAGRRFTGGSRDLAHAAYDAMIDAALETARAALPHP